MFDPVRVRGASTVEARGAETRVLEYLGRRPASIESALAMWGYGDMECRARILLSKEWPREGRTIEDARVTLQRRRCMYSQVGRYTKPRVCFHCASEGGGDHCHVREVASGARYQEVGNIDRFGEMSKSLDVRHCCRQQNFDVLGRQAVSNFGLQTTRVSVT